MIGGPLADNYGRKFTVMVADVFLMIGPIVMGFAPSIAVLIVGRFIVGVRHPY